MKILHLIYDHINNPWVGGGGAVRVHEICRRLADRGHEIIILSGRYPGALDYSDRGLTYRFVGSDKNYMFSTFSYALSAAKYVKKYSDEFGLIVEDFAPWNPAFSSFFAKKPAILHVNHLEGWNILRRWGVFGLPFYLIERFYPKLFGNVTALSEETRKKIRIPDATLVPAGIKGELLDYTAGDDSIIDDDEFVLYIGRLHIRNKGLDTLLTAMKGLKTKLRIAGRGRDEDRLMDMARELDLADFKLSGFVSEEEKISLFRKARIFVLPSRFEGWGIVVLEAAACGRPVIVSDIPELKYAVDAGFGISFRTGDPDDLAWKIRSLLENENKRNDMGNMGREYAKHYSWDRISENYERFLMQVAEGSGH